MAVMGRPKHYSTEDIKNVIDMYVSFTGGTVLLNASKIAEYAEKKLELKNFKYYVINRNLEAKKYIEDLNKELSNKANKKLTSAVTTFTQINVQLYKSMNKEELGKALANLNTLLEDMADSNTKLLKENLGIKNMVIEKDIEIRKLKHLVDEEAQISIESIAELQSTINEQRELINKMKQSMKLKDDTFHLLWDKEAEIVMKHTGVFENDGENPKPKRIITNSEESIIHVAKDAKKLTSAKTSDKLSQKFIERLNKI